LAFVTPLEIGKLREIARSSGPCVTIFLPAYRPGDQTLHSAARLLRNFVQDAARALGVPPDGDLLQPLNAMARDSSTDQGCHWPRALFRSPEFFETVFLREPAPVKCFAGRGIYVLPVLGELNLPPEFYFLRISRKHAGFSRVRFSLERLPMPGNLPDNVDAFLNLDKPDHDRENRAPAGPAANRRIRFGTGAPRETDPDSAAYYRALDRAIQELHPKAPLILGGVEEEIALYREVSSHPELVAGTIGENSPDQEVVDRGYALLREAAIERGLQELADASNRLAPARFLTEPKAISAAAAEGRVLRLFVRAGTDDELTNAAAVETIAHSGDVTLLPGDRMEDQIAAALRY
jgi:hypothetical protein